MRHRIIVLQRQNQIMLRYPSLAIAFALLTVPVTPQEPNVQTVTVCRQAHAHNDYLHDRPLLDALDHGFCSVEADIFLIDGELLVAHSRSELSPDRTLRGLYLDPLRQRIQQNAGSVHGDGHPFTLLIDLKSQGDSTYRALHQLLAEYKDIFSSVTAGKTTENAVTAIVSGNRPMEAIAADSPRYVGIDGRLSDLDSDQSANLMPLISDRWGAHFQWRGKGEMSDADREKLASVVAAAHRKHRKIRFWAIPDNETGWAAMQAAGVDMINTDNLPGLSQFLRSTQDRSPEK